MRINSVNDDGTRKEHQLLQAEMPEPRGILFGLQERVYHPHEEAAEGQAPALRRVRARVASAMGLPKSKIDRRARGGEGGD